MYTGDLEHRIATFEQAAHPINDFAFHPSRPIVAIATGAYDGGFLFEGDLLFWNWETETHWIVLSESREVTRCRFDNGSELAVLFSPHDDEEFPSRKSFETFVGTVLTDWRPYHESGRTRGEWDPRLSPREPVDPRTLGFSRGRIDREEHRADWRARLSDSSYEERHRVWDIAWLDDERILSVDDCWHAEIWSTNDGRIARHSGDGHGVQILQPSDRVCVHVLRGVETEPPRDRSLLCELRNDELVPFRSFSDPVLVSVDRAGRLLCREALNFPHLPRTDYVLESDGTCTLASDLGHYDATNHYIRIDGADGLYFLRGTPPSSHRDKELCRIDTDSRVEMVGKWDDQGRHLMHGDAAAVRDDVLVRSYQAYSSETAYIERYDLDAGTPRWRYRISAPTTELEPLPNEPFVVYALADGSVGMVDWQSGDRLFEEAFEVDELPTVVLSMAARGGRIAIGTLDGRILIAD